MLTLENNKDEDVERRGKIVVVGSNKKATMAIKL